MFGQIKYKVTSPPRAIISLEDTPRLIVVETIVKLISLLLVTEVPFSPLWLANYFYSSCYMYCNLFRTSIGYTTSTLCKPSLLRHWVFNLAAAQCSHLEGRVAS